MLPADPPFLSLAPMQDVTDLAFLRTIAPLGGADLYITPYFRVVSHTDHLDPSLLLMLQENPTNRPIHAQLIGSDPDSLARNARILQESCPIAGIDFNVGCPAPIVCRKDAGGGMLRHPQKLDKVIGTLRDACKCSFSIKTRLGYNVPHEFEDLLPIFHKHAPDMLTIHARTVKEGYQASVHPEFVKDAVSYMSCPVVANGNIVDVQTAEAWLHYTKANGIMIGRGAIRNPWIFTQIRQSLAKEVPLIITRRHVLDYIKALFDETAKLMLQYNEVKHIHRMKKFLVYILQGLPHELEYQVRRATSAATFHSLCEEYLNSQEVINNTPPSGTKLFSHFDSLCAYFPNIKGHICPK